MEPDVNSEELNVQDVPAVPEDVSLPPTHGEPADQPAPIEPLIATKADPPAPLAPEVPAKPDLLPLPKPVSVAEFRARVVEGKRKKMEHRLERLITFAREKKTLKNDDIQLLLRVSDPTASRYAKILITRGILRSVGKTKGLHYLVVE
jgi:hypothetical protein